MGAWRRLVSLIHFFSLLSGGHSSLEPPLPIPNRTVKRVCADDSVPFAHAKVGYRQAIFKQEARSRKSSGFLLLGASAASALRRDRVAPSPPPARAGADAHRTTPSGATRRPTCRCARPAAVRPRRYVPPRHPQALSALSRSW